MHRLLEMNDMEVAEAAQGNRDRPYGSVLEEACEYEESKVAYLKAVEIDPTNAEI